MNTLIANTYKWSLLPGVLVANLTYRRNSMELTKTDTAFDITISCALYYALILLVL